MIKNGNGTTTAQAKDLELVTTIEQETKVKVKREYQNPPTPVNLILDAGSKRIKFLLNGFDTTIDSIYKEVKADLPSGRAGCFNYKNKNYYVGKGCDSVLGELVEGQKDNKIKKLDIWLIGALTSDADFLDDLLTDKRNRYANKPIRLVINLTLLSLSESKRGLINKILTDIGNFFYRGREFSISFKNLDKEFIFAEGYGAALKARSLLSSDVREFSVLDLGGGTLTLTTYKNGRTLPKVDTRTVASGGGMQDLASHIFISLNKTDLGGETKSLNSIFEALKGCKVTDKGFDVPYRIGNRTENIEDSVIDGLSTWVSENPSIAKILTATSQLLVNGQSVYATGGGFAALIVADWIKQQVTNGVSYGHFQVLDNPHIINVTGMQYLQGQTESH